MIGLLERGDGGWAAFCGKSACDLPSSQINRECVNSRDMEAKEGGDAMSTAECNIASLNQALHQVLFVFGIGETAKNVREMDG